MSWLHDMVICTPLVYMTLHVIQCKGALTMHVPPMH
jgi:hypothetical protein